MGNRSALVVGATGLIGRELVKLLLENSHYSHVEIWVRRPLALQHPKLHQRMIDFDHLSNLSFVHPVQDVFCCLGTTMKKAKTKEQFIKVDLEYPVHIGKLAKNFGVEHFLVISAIGANSSSSIFYNQTKGKLEESLQKLRLPRLSIFRPSILMGERDEFRFGEKLGIYTVSLLKFALVGRLKRYRGILGSHVARAMVLVALQKTADLVQIIESEEIHNLANKEEL